MEDENPVTKVEYLKLVAEVFLSFGRNTEGVYNLLDIPASLRSSLMRTNQTALVQLYLKYNRHLVEFFF